MCTESAECDTCFFCLDDVCTVCAANAPAPTTSLISLAMGTAFLLGIAALAIWQRRRELKSYLWSV